MPGELYSNGVFVLQNPPAVSFESKAAYLDFLKGLDQINQQEHLNSDFTGKSAKLVSQVPCDMFSMCEPPVILEDGKVGRVLHERAVWERQVRRR